MRVKCWFSLTLTDFLLTVAIYPLYTEANIDLGHTKALGGQRDHRCLTDNWPPCLIFQCSFAQGNGVSGSCIFISLLEIDSFTTQSFQPNCKSCLFSLVLERVS